MAALLLKSFRFLLKIQKISNVYGRKKTLSYSLQCKDRGEYDLIVMGGGSGGLACASAASSHGARVIVLDYVTPSPHGTKWGLGGTCVNVGCVPKKLFHQAALLGESMRDAEYFGWGKKPVTSSIKWEVLTESVRNYVKSVNWLTSVALRSSNIEYLNAKGSFLDCHTVEAIQKDNSKVKLCGKNILIAAGGRPKYLKIPGGDLAVTSDDIFTLVKPPGRTIIIGAGYVALECAGFLNGLHFPVTLLARGLILRGFDQQMAELIADNLQERGVQILRNSQPLSIAKSLSGSLIFKYIKDGKEVSEECDTVLMAVGRTYAKTTSELNLMAADVKFDPQTFKVLADKEQTNVPHIYAVGDILSGAPELTPVASQAGKLLGNRLFGKDLKHMDYSNIATTVFTPLEYGSVGMSEEKAVEGFGEENIEVYHTYYKPLEFQIPQRSFAQCYLKAICKRKEGSILGMHFLGPSAGEVIQGYAVAIKCNVTIGQLTQTVGIHPTVSEEFTRLFITKRSKLDPTPQLCCS